MHRTAALSLVWVTLLFFSGSIREASASVLDWDPSLSPTGGTDGPGTWDATTANWYNGSTNQAWVTGSSAVFGTAGAGGTVTLASPMSALLVDFNQTGYILSGSTLTLTSSGGTSATAAVNVATGDSAEIDSAITLGASNYFDVQTGSTLTFTGGATLGANTFLTNGTGNIAFTGGTYSGATSALNFSSASVTASGSSTFTTSRLTVGQSSGTSDTFTINGASTSFTQSGGGSINVVGRGGTAGTLDLKAGTVSMSQAEALTYDNTANTQGTLTVEGGSLTLTNTNGVYINYGGTGVNQTGTMSVSGGTVTTTAIDFGSLASATTAYGTGTTGTLNVSGGTVYVGAGGIFETTTYHPVTDTINLSGGTIGGTAAWTSTMGMSLTNTNGGITFQTANSSGTAENIGLSGTLSGGGKLTKTGAGKLTLSGTNTYSGGTVVTAGTLALGNSFGLGSTSASLAVSGGTLDLAGFNATAGTLTGTSSSMGTISDSSATAAKLSVAALNAGGTGSVGALTINGSVGTTTLDLTSAGLTFDLASGSVYDKVTLGSLGAVIFSGTTLSLNDLSGGSLTSGSYELFAAANSSQITSLSGLTLLTTSIDGMNSSLSLDGSGDVLVNLMAVPEPSTLMLMLVASGFLLLGHAWKRRQSSVS